MDQNETDLGRSLRVLTEAPEPPSTVDIKRAMVDGRRLASRRGVLRAGAAAVAVAVVIGGAAATVAHLRTAGPSGVSASAAASAPPAPTSCAVQALPGPQGYTATEVMGGDPSGRYLVGRAYGPDGRYHPLLWTDGVLREVDPAGAQYEVNGIAVNSSGTVFWSGPDYGVIAYHTHEYRDGQISTVPAADGYKVMAVDEAGTLYGLNEQLPGTGSAVRLLTLPAGGAPTVRDLQSVGSDGNGSVSAVGADGTAVGGASTGDARTGHGPVHGVVWRSDGKMVTLPAPPAGDAWSAMVVSSGWAAGISYPWARSMQGKLQDSVGTGVRWNLATGAVTTVPDVPVITAVNRYGWVVGADRDHPVAVLGDHVLRLPVPAGIELPAVVGFGQRPVALSDDGRVIAGALGASVGQLISVRWICS